MDKVLPDASELDPGSVDTSPHTGMSRSKYPMPQHEIRHFLRQELEQRIGPNWKVDATPEQIADVIAAVKKRTPYLGPERDIDTLAQQEIEILRSYRSGPEEMLNPGVEDMLR